MSNQVYHAILDSYNDTLSADSSWAPLHNHRDVYLNASPRRVWNVRDVKHDVTRLFPAGAASVSPSLALARLSVSAKLRETIGRNSHSCMNCLRSWRRPETSKVPWPLFVSAGHCCYREQAPRRLTTAQHLRQHASSMMGCLVMRLPVVPFLQRHYQSLSSHLARLLSILAAIISSILASPLLAYTD